METIGKIRPAHFRNGRSIKGISRDLHVSRETVWKDLWASGYEGGYGRGSSLCVALGEGSGGCVSGDGACSPELRSRRGVPIRLEPRERGYWGKSVRVKVAPANKFSGYQTRFSYPSNSCT